MKLGMDHIGEITDEKLNFLQQMGVEGIMYTPYGRPSDRGYHEYTHLVHLKEWVESYGMELGAVSGNNPWSWHFKWMLGLPGRDEQIENCLTTIRNVGAADIPVFTYNIHALRFYRTGFHARLRGGALGSSFDADLAKNAPLYASTTGVDINLIPQSHRRPITDDDLWANLQYFLDAVVPVAEQAGVNLGIHPDDPQIPEIGGVARIMRSPEAFRKVVEMAPSKNNQLLFCVGCFTEMGADVPAEISYFGDLGKLAWIHFRNIKGTTENFVETFLDEGDSDMLAVMKACKKVGYEGYFTPDHRLRIIGDSNWGHRYWAYALGYIRALLKAVQSE